MGKGNLPHFFVFYEPRPLQQPLQLQNTLLQINFFRLESHQIKTPVPPP